jgi:hypothetical protein
MESLEFFSAIIFNFTVALIIVRFIYYPVKQSRQYVFTFLAFNTMLFFVLGFSSQVEISVGMGFGLFAIFSILRYRTNPIPIREMTYLFVITALPVMNSVFFSQGFQWEIILANLFIILVLALLEKEWGFHYLAHKNIVYENIEFVLPDRYSELLADLCQRTGLDIRRFEVGKISYLNDTAQIKVYFEDATGFFTDEDNGDITDDDD